MHANNARVILLPEETRVPAYEQSPIILRQFTGNLTGRGMPTKGSAGTDRVGRWIQITVAIYLIPVLLVVAVVSGVGMMILGVSETIYGFSERGRQVIQRER